jgi:putative glycosyltransferase (exosortase G-associated)
MIQILSNKFLYWISWIIIPLAIEIVPAFINYFLLLKKKMFGKEEKELVFFPSISIIIPVYNSKATLYQCLKSIDESTYPNESIDVLLVDNGSKDDSFNEFQRAQMDFSSLSINWVYSKQGKARALNKAIFNSNGKYIINIDSDGFLDKHALYNLVKKFENNKDIDCMTGAVLINPEDIKKTKKFFLKQFRVLEYMEYCQAFLAGRNVSAEFNTIFTLSGAFSAFRQSTLLKTNLYNTDTICEDTHLTFQIKKLLGKRVYFCENAIFMVDPIEDLNKFYTQRQRWQIGELEVFHMFYKHNLKNPIGKFFTDSSIRTMILDHTAAFPRIVWYFALLALGFANYSFSTVVTSTILLYFLYVFSSFLFYLNILIFLKPFKEQRNYYKTKVLYLLFLPIYNLFAYFVRMAGILNCITRSASWKTDNFTDEKKKFNGIVDKDFDFISRFRKYLKNVFEYPEGETDA